MADRQPRPRRSQGLGCVAGVGNLAVQHCQLVAEDGDLDVLVIWFGTETDQRNSQDLWIKNLPGLRGDPSILRV